MSAELPEIITIPIKLSLGTIIGTDEDFTLADLIAANAARLLVEDSRVFGSGLFSEVRARLEAEVSRQVTEAVRDALAKDPAGDAPMTLADAIYREARAQLDRGERYQGTATPLTQVVAAQVYEVIREKVIDAADKVSAEIRGQTEAAIARALAERGWMVRPP
jgi:hypothetical protein